MTNILFPEIQPLNDRQTLQIVRLEAENVKLKSQVEAVRHTVQDWDKKASEMDIYPESEYGRKDQLFECCRELNKILS